MADFMDREAEVSDNEDDEGPSHEKKKKKKQKLINDSSEEDDEEDEEALRDEMKDLINDDEEEEPDDSDDDLNKKRKHGDDDDSDSDDLDEEDWALLQDNLGERIVPKKKKFKRVKRIADEESDKEPEDAREAIANELFDDDDAQPISSRRDDSRTVDDDALAVGSGSEESDDEDNFIVDDEDRPISKPRKKKGHHRYTDEAMQQAQDIFGVDFDFEEDVDAAEVENYEEEGEEDEYEEEGEEGDRPRKKKGKKKMARKSIYEIYEPELLERSHLTEADNQIKQADMPERFSTRATKVIQTGDEDEIAKEAKWILKYAFTEPCISLQNSEVPMPLAGFKSDEALNGIMHALKFMRTELQEVPFIAHYRKEYIQVSEESEANLTVNDLWTVYRWDEKYCQLEKRKANLIQLLRNMQTYQAEVHGDLSVINEDIRFVNDDEVKHITDKVFTFEAFNDSLQHFQLYFSGQVPVMKIRLLSKQKEQLKQERLAKKLPGAADDPEAAEEEEDDDEVMRAKLARLKLGQRKDIYTICQEAGLLKFVKKFGFSPEQYGEILFEEYGKYEVENLDISPEEAAAPFINNRFADAEAVLTAARLMHAKQISVDPKVRGCLRTRFYENAVVNVQPTKKGLKERIDENHPCYTKKYLKNKPIKEFANDSFLQLLIAEKDGLLKVTVTIDKQDDDNPYLKKAIDYYQDKSSFSDVVKRWNEERKKVIETAFKTFLYPSMEKEVKAKMRQEAIEAIIQKCADKLNDWIRTAPYQPAREITEDEDFDTREGVRVMGIAFVPTTDQSAFAAVIDGDGEVTDHLRLPNFMLRRGEFAPKSEQLLRTKDHNRLREFILAKRPHVIALASETPEARRVHMDIVELVQDLCSNEQFPPIRIEIVDNEMSTVYMNSKRSLADFHDYPDLLREAISLARRLQDPLVEFSQLCTPDNEILCLKYHALQEHLPEDALLEALHTQFINSVNEVGVDVNRAIAHPHTAQLTQFIAGLGPRKASNLLRMLKKQPTPLLESRTQLIMNCKFGAKVFVNCAGFIKIDTSQLSDTGTDTYIEVLDSTRVHPEAYEWARKMAIDALEYEDESDTNPASALEEVLEHPEKLRDLDLEAFAEELYRQGYGLKRTTLLEIREELTNRYKDNRRPYQSPDAEELFSMLTKETPETLFHGKLVIGTVTRIARKTPEAEAYDNANPVRDEETTLWKCPFCSKNDFPELSDVWNHFDAKACPGEPLGVSVRLDNGINGFVKTEKLSDKAVNDPSERVQPGMTVHARVIKVNVDRFSVDLTCRSSDLNDIGFDFRAQKDDYYDYLQERNDQDAEEASKKKQNRPTYTKRIIVHPSFKNVDFGKAVKMMNDLSQGEAIIRPSSKGDDHLTLTWKVHDGIYQHVDIKEKGKDNPFSLGSQLYIEGESYEDLDEIIARYVTPVAAHARDLISFRYFRDADGGDREILKKLLDDEKRKQPSKIHYFVSASRDLPGKFLLAYLPRNKVFHEYITVLAEGFKYRQKIFHSVNSLFRWFKEHFRDPIPRATPMATPVQHTPSMSGTPSLQAIHRVAVNLPNNVFDSLSRVTGSSYSGTPTAAGAYGAAQGGWNQATPNQRTPATGTPRQTGTPQAGWSGMPPPNAAPPRSTPGNYGAGGSSRSGGNRGSGSAWSDIADGWDKSNNRRPGGRSQPKTPSYNTPGASSQMSISPTASPAFARGDQTPLVDEWN
ncbi:Transcription elongation factor SPT6 [Halotydeus destructor]|nr:Transcription elongation factor SPT6 [Halotydeus destructor]